ncbi:MAG: HNH endonuclease [Cyanophyceae cyanobacterium]
MHFRFELAINNLQTLCRQCNQQKRDRMDPRFRPYF